MNKDKQRQAAANAKAILENQGFQDSFEAVRQAYIKSMIGTDPREQGQRDYYHICVKALEDVKNVLTLHVQNGKVMEKDLKRKAKGYK